MILLVLKERIFNLITKNNMEETKLIIEFIELSGFILKNESFLSLRNYIQHGKTSIFDHVINVSFECFRKNYHNKRIDKRSLVVGALLHDFFLYDWHKSKKETGRKGLHGYKHAKIAMEKASKEFFLSEKEKKMILTHMWPLNLFKIPSSKEAWILCKEDKNVSLRECFRLDNKNTNLFNKIDEIIEIYKKV